jgi:L,D-peptidoglycan transpeptidase YkuD (ErfK/YbiS/YcfS/YnhG family)
VRGRGSGIFLHAMGSSPTNGCVSLRLANLVQTLRWLRPGAGPRITIRLSGR